jgi:hypothetical protein
MNPVALEINQDALAAQARRIRSSPPVHSEDDEEEEEEAAESGEVVAVAAPCESSSRRTQRWFWTRAVDATEDEEEDKEGGPITTITNGTLYTRDGAGQAWCLAMPTSGLWSVVPYVPGNASHPTACLDNGSPSSWRAELVRDAGNGLGEYAFVWRSGNRKYGFSWGQDPMSSGPLPHTRWLQSNAGGNWIGNLSEAAEDGSSGACFSPAGPVIDDDAVGGVTVRDGAGFCLDLVRGGNVETWTGPLEGGKVTVAVLNRSPLAQTVAVRFADVGLGNASSVAVRSAWQEAGSHHGDAYSCEVPARGAALLVLEPSAASRAR